MILLLEALDRRRRVPAGARDVPHHLLPAAARHRAGRAARGRVLPAAPPHDPVGQRVRDPDGVDRAEAAGGVRHARRRRPDVLGRHARRRSIGISWLTGFLPLPVLELSHFVGSLVGFGLLVVSWGLARRLDAAYFFAIVFLGLGIAASLLKGGDYEEAIILATLLVIFLPSHQEFDRKAALFDIPFSTAWLTATCAVVIASVFLGLFAFRHVEYSQDLWWRFEAEQDAPRFLRATVGVLVAMLFVGLRQLLRPAPPRVVRPDDEELAVAAKVLAGEERTWANLVFLRDKALLWNDDRTAFLMYGVQGRTWAALGDPVGPRDKAEGLVKRFLERVDDYQGVPVFYEATRDWLHKYADFGLTFAKLGEEAHVPLTDFTLDGGGTAKTLRMTLQARPQGGLHVPRRAGARDHARAHGRASHRCRTNGCRTRRPAEKGFSLGFFDESYLARFPIAVMERGGHVEAFANLWPGAGSTELSMDLMRYRSSGAKRHHGCPARVDPRVGPRTGLPAVQPRDGAAGGSRGIAGRPALVALGPLRLRPRRDLLQLQGTADLQGEVPSDLGAALSRLSGRPQLCRGSWRTSPR